jgi:hypothetical protein
MWLSPLRPLLFSRSSSFILRRSPHPSPVGQLPWFLYHPYLLYSWRRLSALLSLLSLQVRWSLLSTSSHFPKNLSSGSTPKLSNLFSFTDQNPKSTLLPKYPRLTLSTIRLFAKSSRSKAHFTTESYNPLTHLALMNIYSHSHIQSFLLAFRLLFAFWILASNTSVTFFVILLPLNSLFALITRAPLITPLFHTLSIPTSPLLNQNSFPPQVWNNGIIPPI